MGKKAPSPPPAPDPAATAAAQATANKESAIAQAQINQINQYTPYGTLEYTQRGESEDGTPQYSATQTLAPEQQAILDQQNQAALNYGQTANRQLDSVSDTLSQPLDISALGPAPVLNEDTRSNVANALYDRMNPQYDRDLELLQTRLSNQGFTDPGSEAYRAEMDNFNRGRNDARLAVESAALNQASQLYGLEANQRDRSVNELIQGRTQPLNELAAMMTGTQVQGPQFITPPQQQIAPGDIMGATYGSANLANQNYAQQVAAQNAGTQGLYGLLGSGLMAGAYAFSDRRLKTNIRKVGRRNGLNVYAFNYVWGQPAVGFMADEVKAKFPHAVKTIGGFDAVNYAEVW
jgi:hypothetical protein